MISQEGEDRVIPLPGSSARGVAVDAGQELFDFRPGNIFRAPIGPETAGGDQLGGGISANLVMQIKITKERADRAEWMMQSHGAHAALRDLSDEGVKIGQGDVVEVFLSTSIEEGSQLNGPIEVSLACPWPQALMETAELDEFFEQSPVEEPTARLLGRAVESRMSDIDQEVLDRAPSRFGQPRRQKKSLMLNLSMKEAVDQCSSDICKPSDSFPNQIVMEVKNLNEDFFQMDCGEPLVRQMAEVSLPMGCKQGEAVLHHEGRLAEYFPQGSLVGRISSRNVEPFARHALGRIAVYEFASARIAEKIFQPAQCRYRAPMLVPTGFLAAQIFVDDDGVDLLETQILGRKPAEKQSDARFDGLDSAWRFLFRGVDQVAVEDFIHHDIISYGA